MSVNGSSSLLSSSSDAPPPLLLERTLSLRGSLDSERDWFLDEVDLLSGVALCERLPPVLRFEDFGGEEDVSSAVSALRPTHLSELVDRECRAWVGAEAEGGEAATVELRSELRPRRSGFSLLPCV